MSLTEDRESVPVKILRDTGATQSSLAANVLPLSEKTSIEASVLIQGVELGVISVPLHKVYLRSELVRGPVIIGVRPTLPIQGVSLILGNDLAGGKVKPKLQVVSNLGRLLSSATASDGLSGTFPACVVTRATERRMQEQEDQDSDDSHLTSSNTRSHQESHDLSMASNLVDTPFSRSQLAADQAEDSEVCRLAQGALSEEEADLHAQCFYIKSGDTDEEVAPT